MSFEYLDAPALLTRQMIAAAMFAKAGCRQILEVGGGRQSIARFLYHPCHLMVVDPMIEDGHCYIPVRKDGARGVVKGYVETNYIQSSISRLDSHLAFDGMVYLGLDGRAATKTLVKWADSTEFALFECSRNHKRSYIQLTNICNTIKLPLLWSLATHYAGTKLDIGGQFLDRAFVAFGRMNEGVKDGTD